ncbi:MAG: TRAP transporter small permease [Deltaproteobacteria bacterium]|nr:TRAP transporter small permease [Deltaproteobacteria bacterium]MBW1921565.1 TRAP transporter small permease [Deltaproteobacteria bacterium]MBW1931494.1 TRAP transporter small permease [Deltaproteobacteria bacterium]MBW1978553.1 TRAP transporter small permease [Deltaproteobacteria bacterium]MBW2044867.1 TRAP transporter small permease [Deltaproteobacteria bacterium]
MTKKKTVHAIGELYKLVRYSSGIAASICIFIMVCTIVPDSIGRYFFSRPIYGTLELNTLLMSAIVFLSLAWTQSQRGHVRVEVLISRVRPTLHGIFNIICWTLGFVLFLAITIGGTQEAIRSVMIGENLWGVEKFPLWPGKILAAFGSGLLCVQFLIDIGAEAIGIFSHKATENEAARETEGRKE